MNAITEALLPKNYVAARAALDACLEESDENFRARCAAMTDEEKFAELATQARMADDKYLERAAARIRSRASKKLAEAVASGEAR